MTVPHHRTASRVRTDDLKQALQAALRDHFQTACSIIQLDREVSKYSSSFVIEKLTVRLGSGVRLALIFKNLGNPTLQDQHQMTRPGFMSNPAREIDVSRRILATDSIGTARCLGSVCNLPKQRFWLFLEKIDGLELYQHGDFEIWIEVARWLARFHERFENPEEGQASGVSLLTYNRDFYLAWPARAKVFLHDQPKSVVKNIAWINDHYEFVADRLAGLPVTLLHGDFNASNIIVQLMAQSLRICPVDWEMAALGPGLIDLAALVSGNWSSDQRNSLAGAYFEELGRGGRNLTDKHKFHEDLKYCQLHLAMQWLGWSQNWSPPVEHKRDWLQHAVALAKQIGL